MAGISSKAAGSLENHKKFVGREFDEDLGINLYEFKWRNHDPQIGRFIEIDPLADDYEYNTPYAYAENRPIDGIDLEGLEYCRSVGNAPSAAWFDVIKPAMDWVNANLNPVTPIVELISGKDYNNGNFDISKSRIQSASETIITIIPGAKVESTVIKATEKVLANDAVKTIDKEALKRGVKNEEKVLAEEGLSKNTKSSTVVDSKTGRNVTTVPDAMKNGGTVEVKDVKNLSDSKQLRAQKTVSPPWCVAHATRYRIKIIHHRKQCTNCLRSQSHQHLFRKILRMNSDS